MTTEKRSLQYGMIGCGMMGQEHLRNMKLLDNVELPHAFEPDEGMRTQMKRQVPSIQFHDSIKALLKGTEVDAWVIASPNFRHAEQLELNVPRINNYHCQFPINVSLLINIHRSFYFLQIIQKRGGHHFCHFLLLQSR